MTEIKDEELRRFVSENKERILDILAESLPSEEDVDKAFTYAEKAESKVSKVKDKAEDVAKDAYRAFMAPEVYRHFIRMGMEFFMGLNALAERMPMPDKVKRLKDDLSEAESGAKKEMCRVNTDCPRKTSDGPERIEID